MVGYALVAVATTIVVAPVAYLLGRNGQQIMVDVDRLAAPYRTCPPVDLDTELRKLVEDEGKK